MKHFNKLLLILNLCYNCGRKRGDLNENTNRCTSWKTKRG